MFDSHCHLDFPELLTDLDKNLQEARSEGVSGWFVPGTRPEQWRGLPTVKRKDVSIGVGLHPWETVEAWNVDALCAELQERALELGAVAVGECGLDKFRGGTIERQTSLFEAQLRLAGELELPVVLHQVGYQKEFLSCLERVGLPDAGGVVHGFGGDTSFGRALCRRGLLLGVGLGITHESRRKLRGAVAELPLDVWLLETDAPDQGPAGVDRGGLPLDLAQVCSEVARLKHCPKLEVSEVTEASTRALYDLSAV